MPRKHGTFAVGEAFRMGMCQQKKKRGYLIGSITGG
jgi:hypothetical protein